MKRSLKVLAVGDLENTEWSEALQAIDRDATLTLANNSEQQADLVVVFQMRPGNFSADWVRAARERLPLAGFVTVLGTWCEGEQRTGTPLPFCERIYWYHFETWWQTTQRQWRAGRPTSWQNLHTMPIENREKTASAAETPFQAPKLVAIDAPDADAPDALLVACDAIGYSALWTPTWRAGPLSSPPSAGIWVGGQLNQDEEQRLARFCKRLPADVPLVALLDFPRRDRVERATELGATAVLGKPWRLDDLATCLRG